MRDLEKKVNELKNRLEKVTAEKDQKIKELEGDNGDGLLSS